MAGNWSVLGALHLGKTVRNTQEGRKMEEQGVLWEGGTKSLSVARGWAVGEGVGHREVAPLRPVSLPEPTFSPSGGTVVGRVTGKQTVPTSVV